MGIKWDSDDTIVFSEGVGSPLMRIPVSGGVPQPVTALRPEEGEVSHTDPEILPGGALLFDIFTGSVSRAHGRGLILQ